MDDNDLDDDTSGGVHWSFWIIGCITLIFNSMGALNFFVQITADSLENFPEFYHPIIEGRPAWATAAFAVSVLGGALGCLLILLQKSVSFHVFAASLLGVLVTMVHMFNAVGFDSFEVWMGAIMQLVVAMFLTWYSRDVGKKGWLS